jgi:hypothetical protein
MQAQHMGRLFRGQGLRQWKPAPSMISLTHEQKGHTFSLWEDVNFLL